MIRTIIIHLFFSYWWGIFVTGMANNIKRPRINISLLRIKSVLTPIINA